MDTNTFCYEIHEVLNSRVWITFNIFSYFYLAIVQWLGDTVRYRCRDRYRQPQPICSSKSSVGPEPLRRVCKKLELPPRTMLRESLSPGWTKGNWPRDCEEETVRGHYCITGQQFTERLKSAVPPRARVRDQLFMYDQWTADSYKHCCG